MDHRPVLPIAPQGFGQVKQAPIPQGVVRPPSMEVQRSQAPPSLAPIQDRTQPPSQPAINLWKDRPAVAIPKVMKPAWQHRLQLSTDGGHWPGAQPPCLLPQLPSQVLEALLPRPALAPLVVPPQKVKSFPQLHNPGLRRRQSQAPLFQDPSRYRQGRLPPRDWDYRIATPGLGGTGR
jgi:hypothetical protein